MNETVLLIQWCPLLTGFNYYMLLTLWLVYISTIKVNF